jgi:predicted nucleotidyltransferase
VSDNLQNMVRLKQFEIDAIRAAFAALFLSDDKLWLFGSRANLNKRGGDIDLYVETTLDAKDLYDIKFKFINAICDSIGDQRIDVVLNTINNSLNLPIYKKAKSEGVQLV